MNSKKSSTTVTRIAVETLKNPSSSKIAKQLAGSVLAQTNTKKQTGSELETIASKVLNSNKYSSETETLAGSILSQSNKKR